VHELAAGTAFPCSRQPLILFNLDDTARTSDHSPVAQTDISTSPRSRSRSRSFAHKGLQPEHPQMTRPGLRGSRGGSGCHIIAAHYPAIEGAPTAGWRSLIRVTCAGSCACSRQTAKSCGRAAPRRGARRRFGRSVAAYRDTVAPRGAPAGRKSGSTSAFWVSGGQLTSCGSVKDQKGFGMCATSTPGFASRTLWVGLSSFCACGNAGCGRDRRLGGTIVEAMLTARPSPLTGKS
jgi:hypothetical protein